MTNITGTNQAYSPGANYSGLLYGAAGGGTTFTGLGGVDIMFGTGLNNTADYSQDAANGGTAGIIAYLPSNFVQDGFGTYDYVSGIQNITGTASNDTIFGDTNANYLLGGVGNDYMSGGGGADTIQGGLGSDLIYARAGNATIISKSSDMALGDADYFSGFHAGDMLNFSADLQGKLIIVAGASSDVVIYAPVAGGFWYMDVANATLAQVNAAGVITYT